ncbi:MAG: TraB/GumN family protein [Thiotrichales bacterium]|nr:TraB/GumN family protein [Thiotrichales bacterium]
MKHIFLFSVLTIGVSPEILLAGEKELEQQCAPYRQKLPAVDPETIDYSYTDGLLWKITKGETTSYLFGTMHTQDQRYTDVPPQVRLAMSGTDIFLTEVEQDQAAGRVFLDAIYRDNGPSLDQQLHPELFGLLKFKAEKYGIPEDKVAHLRPWAAFSLIGRPRPNRALTLDQVLINYAFSRNQRVEALETMQELVSSLDRIPAGDQLEILSDTLCNHEKILKNSWELLQMYIRADLRGIVTMNAQAHRDENVYRRFTGIMVEQRNLRMLDRMLPYFEQGDAFAAVGASHLPGKTGLLKLLVRKGFTVEHTW